MNIREKLINYLIKNKGECTLTEAGRATPHNTKAEREAVIKKLERENLLTVKRVSQISINKGSQRKYTRTILRFDYNKYIKM